MRLLIVDDDYQIREGIRNGIEWEQTGVAEIKTCANGKEAVQEFKKWLPDLIIADIQMPGMTGLEMIGKIREISSTAKVIFISAYSEFDYCRQALLLGADDYVLKPIELSEFMNVIQKNIAKLNEERLKKWQYEKTVIAQSTLAIYKKNSKEDEDVVLGLLANEYPFMAQGYVITIIIQLDKYYLEEEQKREEIAEALQNHFKRKLAIVLNSQEGIVGVSPGHNSALATLYIQGEIKCKLLEWNQIYEDKYGRISAGISYSHGRKQLLLGYEQAKAMTERLFYYEQGTILVFDNQYMKSEYPAAEWERIRNSVREKEGSIIRQATARFVESAKLNLLEPEAFRRKIIEYYCELCDERMQITDIDSLREEMANCQTARACESVVYEWADRKCLRFGSEKMKPYSHPIETAIHYIENHYHEQITVVEVSKAVGKSPNYFSSVFKKEVGESFSRYLNCFRLERARWLLLHSNEKVSEIAISVGYMDYAYFSKLFHNYFGCSASKMRIRR